MVFWYVTIDHSAFSTLRENPQVDNKPPRLFGSVPGGGSPLNHWLSREGTTKMQKGQFMDPLYEAFPSSNRSKLIVWDPTYLPILLIWASISPPLSPLRSLFQTTKGSSFWLFTSASFATWSQSKAKLVMRWDLHLKCCLLRAVTSAW